jgi:hypothetical protein
MCVSTDEKYLVLSPALADNLGAMVLPPARLVVAAAH